MEATITRGRFKGMVFLNFSSDIIILDCVLLESIQTPYTKSENHRDSETKKPILYEIELFYKLWYHTY